MFLCVTLVIKIIKRRGSRSGNLKNLSEGEDSLSRKFCFLGWGKLSIWCW